MFQISSAESEFVEDEFGSGESDIFGNGQDSSVFIDAELDENEADINVGDERTNTPYYSTPIPRAEKETPSNSSVPSTTAPPTPAIAESKPDEEHSGYGDMDMFGVDQEDDEDDEDYYYSYDDIGSGIYPVPSDNDHPEPPFNGLNPFGNIDDGKHCKKIH